MSKMSTDIPPIRHAMSGKTMGTRYSAVVYTNPGFDVAALSTALFEAVDRVDQHMSTWKPGSDLNRLNAAPVGDWITLPPDVIQVLQMAQQVGARSGGAFDVSVGESVAAWGFGAHAAEQRPDPVNSARERAAGCAFELDMVTRRARLLRSASLDLSGIAKGFGVDELGRVMGKFGITRWLVGIDGEMRAGGSKPDGSPWLIAQERSEAGIREAMGAFELTDRAVATSGTYRHCHDMGDRTISHTIDPRTGRPIANALSAVTVLAQTCMEADAWATAFLVMGSEKALPLARIMGMDTVFVLADGTVQSSL